MMSGKEQIYFLIDAIDDIRTITPSGRPLIIDPTNKLNRNYTDIELMQLFTKLEKDKQILKVLKIPHRIKQTDIVERLYPYGYADDGCYHIELLPVFDEYFHNMQNEPEYQEFTGYIPPAKQAQSNESRIETLYEKIAEVDEQIKIRREAWANAQDTINKNPFYAEATRVGNLAKLEQQAQTDIGNFIKQKETYLDEISLRQGIPLSRNSQTQQETNTLANQYDQLLKEVMEPNNPTLDRRYNQALKEIKSSQHIIKPQTAPRANDVNSFTLTENVLSINGKTIKFKKDARTLVLLKSLVKKSKGIYFSEEAKKLEGAIVDDNKDPKDIYYEVCRGIENRLAKMGITNFLEYDYNQAKINPRYKNLSK